MEESLCCSFMMAVWWQFLILLCCILNYVESSAPSTVPQNKYRNSFRLAMSTRINVQHVVRIYKQEQLGNKHFKNRSRHLKDLPLISTDFYSWLNLTDWERLHVAFWDMQTYWNMLEWKRTQLETEKKEVTGQAVHSTLSQSFKHIQLDLRDLMSQVNQQMSSIQSSWMKPTSPMMPLNLETTSKTVWDSRVEGYIILRDLDLYLTKLARDFLLLASKKRTTQD